MPRVKRSKARYRAYRLGAQKPLRKGIAFRKIIASVYIAPNNEYALHATKGWRWRRLPKRENKLLAGLMQQLSE